jgi:hypothetical protein
MDAVSARHKGDVNVIVDDEHLSGGGGDRPQLACRRQQLAARHLLLPELDDVGTSPHGRGGQRRQAPCLDVRRDEVQPGGGD